MMELTAKTFHGLEEVLADEIKSLGGTDIQVNRRVVTFNGDKKTLYRCNYESRLAINFLMPIARFKAQKEDELYEQVKSIEWDKFMHSRNSMVIQSTVRSDHFTHSHYAALKTKDAICDYFRDKHGDRPNISKDRADIMIDLNIRDDKVIISLNSTGQPLFKRGYRKVTGPAPLNEILAAGLVKLSGWDMKSPFMDPMCGSGTIAIEAAAIAARIPVGELRRFYSVFKWPSFNQKIWDELRNEAEANIQERIPRITASDSSLQLIKKARLNLEAFEERIKVNFQAFNINELIEAEPGTAVIFNPPYGERMNKMDGIKDYAALGDVMKEKFKGCSVWIITSDRDAIKHIGLKTTSRINLKNGPLDCTFRQFDIF